MSISHMALMVAIVHFSGILREVFMNAYVDIRYVMVIVKRNGDPSSNLTLVCISHFVNTLGKGGIIIPPAIGK